MEHKRKSANEDAVAEMIEILTGSITAIGETNHDNKCLENMDFIFGVVDYLLDDLQLACADAIKEGLYMASVKRVYDKLYDKLREINENTAEWLEEYRVDEE